MGVSVGTAYVIGAVVAAGGAVYASQQQKKAQARAQEQARKAKQMQQNQAILQARERIVQQQRESRIREATVMQTASAAGVLGSSGQIGAVGSIGSQLAANTNFIDQNRQLSAQASAYSTAARQEQIAGQTQAAWTSTIAGTAGPLFQAGAAGGLFGSPSVSPSSSYGTEEYNRMVRNREL